MNIYIGYKLSNIPEEQKRTLRDRLEQISDILSQNGHETFIMGRDVQNWSKEYYPSTKTIKQIVKHLKNYDILLAFIESNVSSMGMVFETILAKLLGKKVYCLIKKDIKDNKIQVLCNKEEYFDDFNSIENNIKTLLNNK